MSLRDLSLCERLVLCTRTEEACVQRLRAILDRADPSDEPFRGLIGELMQEEAEHAETIRSYQEKISCPLVWRMNGALMERLVAEYFPSLREGLGEGRLSRKGAAYFIESLETDSSRFYRALAECAPDTESRDVFARMAAGEESHVRELRDGGRVGGRSSA
jgi:hypothetical protein